MHPHKMEWSFRTTTRRSRRGADGDSPDPIDGSGKGASAKPSVPNPNTRGRTIHRCVDLTRFYTKYLEIKNLSRKYRRPSVKSLQSRFKVEIQCFQVVDSLSKSNGPSGAVSNLTFFPLMRKGNKIIFNMRAESKSEPCCLYFRPFIPN